MAADGAVNYALQTPTFPQPFQFDPQKAHFVFDGCEFVN
jgi:hypothetical protein